MENQYQKFINQNDFDKREFIGCTVEEINILKEKHPYKPKKLPDTLSHYLLFGGHQMADFQPTSEFGYTSILNYTLNLGETFLNPIFCKQYFSQNFTETFPHNGLIVAFNQGYQFYFIKLEDGEDPPVYYYDNDPERVNFSKLHNSFSEYISKLLDSYSYFHQQRIRGASVLKQSIFDLRTKILDSLDLFKEVSKSTNVKYFNYAYEYCIEAYDYIYELFDDFEDAIENLGRKIRISKRTIEKINTNNKYDELYIKLGQLETSFTEISIN